MSLVQVKVFVQGVLKKVLMLDLKFNRELKLEAADLNSIKSEYVFAGLYRRREIYRADAFFKTATLSQKPCWTFPADYADYYYKNALLIEERPYLKICIVKENGELIQECAKPTNKFQFTMPKGYTFHKLVADNLFDGTDLSKCTSCYREEFTVVASDIKDYSTLYIIAKPEKQ